MPKKCYTHVSVEECETLSQGLAQGHALRTMATVLGRVPSTVSREHARNTNTMSGPYIVPARRRPWWWPRARQPRARGDRLTGPPRQLDTHCQPPREVATRTVPSHWAAPREPNGLLRQYPPGAPTCPGHPTRADHHRLTNTRPRTCLNWATPLRSHAPSFTRFTWNLKPPSQIRSQIRWILPSRWIWARVFIKRFPHWCGGLVSTTITAQHRGRLVHL
jgi:hypothetical protein